MMTPAAEAAEIAESRRVVALVLRRWKRQGHKPSRINNGSCFESADDIAGERPDRFTAVGIGNLMLYRGNWKDEEYAFDEELLSRARPGYQPLGGHRWKDMFDWGVFSWPGIHAWAHCEITGLCFDAETPEGVTNPFALHYFHTYWTAMDDLKRSGVDLVRGDETIRRPSRDARILKAHGWRSC